jgi:RNA polymerase sigma factor (sigma-70 family)
LVSNRRFSVEGELERLIAEHHGAVRAVLRGILKHPEDVEDCCQNTFLTATTQIERVSQGARRAWLIQVARNKAFELIRRGKIGKSVFAELAERIVEKETDRPLQHVLSAEEQVAVRTAIGSLPEVQRNVLSLRVEHELTFQEIADRLGIPLGTALTRMRMALDTLRETLNRD